MYRSAKEISPKCPKKLIFQVLDRYIVALGVAISADIKKSCLSIKNASTLTNFFYLYIFFNFNFFLMRYFFIL